MLQEMWSQKLFRLSDEEEKLLVHLIYFKHQPVCGDTHLSVEDKKNPVRDEHRYVCEE